MPKSAAPDKRKSYVVANVLAAKFRAAGVKPKGGRRRRRKYTPKPKSPKPKVRMARRRRPRYPRPKR